ncbi:MAG: sulfotransferase domain-containing protein [Kiloniellales bacterium]
MGAIIWLASYPKSGNTWARAFLHNLLMNREQPSNINELYTFCLGEDKAEYYNQFDPRPLSTLTAKEVAELRPKVHDLLTKAHPDSVFVKTHNFLGEYEGVPLVTMECTAGAVYIIRNPLDVAISYARHYGISTDEGIEHLGNPVMGSATTDRVVRQVYGSWSTNVKSWAQHPFPSLHVMRYEDMYDRPFKTFGDLGRFLGLNPPRERLRRAIRNCSFKVLQRQERTHGFIERSTHARFFREGKPGQWRKVLSEEQIKRIISDHREQMERFDYVPKGH